MTVRILQGAALALAVGALSASLSFMIGTQPTLALDAGQAEAVVSVMEELTAEMGESMTTDGAEEFYDYDELSAARIPAAGFDRDGWIEAYEAVAAGYLAIIPQADIDAMFAEPLALLDASELPEDQKAEMRAHVAELTEEVLQVRESGMAHVEVVRPFVQRLHPLFGTFGE